MSALGHKRIILRRSRSTSNASADLRWWKTQPPKLPEVNAGTYGILPTTCVKNDWTEVQRFDPCAGACRKSPRPAAAGLLIYTRDWTLADILDTALSLVHRGVANI
jgi:hypothetical protein